MTSIPVEQNPPEAEILVEVSGISKKFCRSLRLSLYYAVRDLGREFTGRSVKPGLRKDEFWALQGVSFTLRRGEALGIIGPNGAGKSTLLKIFTGIIKPTKGFVRTRGRVQALIELTAGINLILSGRENIYLRAMLFGLSKDEIDEKLDEIIEFSELGEFIDMPMQNYSTGMRVKLGFAIAINVNPDILILDEVLAVGDQRFRTKARKAMQKLLDRNVTLIFISHNMSQVMGITERTLWIEEGNVRKIGPSKIVCMDYMNSQNSSTTRSPHPSQHKKNLGYFEIESLSSPANDTLINGILTIGNKLEDRIIRIELILKSLKQVNSRKYFFNIILINSLGTKIAYNTINDTINSEEDQLIPKHIKIDFSNLLPGRYCIGLYIYPQDFLGGFDFASDCIFQLDVPPFAVRPEGLETGQTNPTRMNMKSDGFMLLPANFVHIPDTSISSLVESDINAHPIKS